MMQLMKCLLHNKLLLLDSCLACLQQGLRAS